MTPSATGDPLRKGHLSLGLLCLVAAISMIDRQVLSMLLQPIKNDLHISDAALGALGGTAFGVFYATAAFPLARYADRGDRRLLLSLCIGFWSLATAASGLAQNFIQLALARIGVAVGEAGGTPASHSLIADLYPPEKRTSALAFLSASLSAGIAFGLFLGGALAAMFDWRVAFFVVGLPGLLAALIVYFALEEPRNRVGAEAIATAPPLKETLKAMWAQRSLRWIFVVALCGSFTGYGLLTWAPTFFLRVHHMDIASVGLWSGIATIFGLGAGNLCSGFLADKIATRDARWFGGIAAIGLGIAGPLMIAFATTNSASAAIGIFFALKFFTTLWFPPLFSLAFSLVPARTRAFTSATLAMVVNLAGLGLGPLVIGLVSDHFNAQYGVYAIRYSLIVVSSGLFIGAIASLFVVFNTPKAGAAAL